MARWADAGKACALLSPVNGDRLEIVYYLHASLYLVYVGSMLSILYFSFLKPTFFADEAQAAVEPSTAGGVLEVKPASQPASPSAGALVVEDA